MTILKLFCHLYCMLFIEEEGFIELEFFEDLKGLDHCLLIKSLNNPQSTVSHVIFHNN